MLLHKYISIYLGKQLHLHRRRPRWNARQIGKTQNFKHYFDDILNLQVKLKLKVKQNQKLIHQNISHFPPILIKLHDKITTSIKSILAMSNRVR